MITLDALTPEDCEQIRRWRNAVLGTLRTPFLLTAEQQAAFYRDVVCNRNAPHRYWAVREGSLLAGQVGLVGIEWENRFAEISLIVDPSYQRQGVGAAAVDLVLTEAFDRMGLATVWGECYANNPAMEFWKRQVVRYDGTATMIPRRKFWDGKHWDSLHFTFSELDYRAKRKQYVIDRVVSGGEPSGDGGASGRADAVPGSSPGPSTKLPRGVRII